MNVKVQGGTAKHHGENLCLGCSHASIRRDVGGKAFIKCMEFGKFISSPTVFCNQWHDKEQMDLWQMRQVAWVIQPGREHLGFKPYKKLAAEEREKVDQETTEFD